MRTGLTVTRNETDDRYEIHEGDTLLGFAAYQLTPTLAVLTHTEVFPGSEGRGVGSTLVRGALDDVRERGLSVLPICSFVQAFLGRHPDYADLDYRATQSSVED
ncbi:MAG: GNAT family N-acetyltransferase [Nocardioides sp.]